MTGGLKPSPLPSSFRDPAGFLFSHDGQLYRQVNDEYRPHYDRLMASGLYDALERDGLLVPHEETDLALAPSPGAYKVLRPERLAFVSYPYEWCFSQLKHAALAALRIQSLALAHGMTLKDCSAYNFQFSRGRPTLIDTLSFEIYEEGPPWLAYRQFCQHFLAPLALIAYRDARLGQLLRLHLDGIPLDLASSLLPFRSRLLPSLLSHLHLHGASQRHFAGAPAAGGPAMSRPRLLALLGSLRSAVEGLRWRPAGDWADYYARSTYSPEALEEKRRLVRELIQTVSPAPRIVWDLGANVGLFSRIASERGILTVAFDGDVAAVEANYQRCAREAEARLVPLVMDLANPSPGQGWAHQERLSLLERGPADVVLALALVHHLAIGNNVPLAPLADFFARIGRWLIIEFVPREDPQVERMLAHRRDIFAGYTREAFEGAFGRHFDLVRSAGLPGTHRTIHLLGPAAAR